jgi:hypothetical protein
MTRFACILVSLVMVASCSDDGGQSAADMAVDQEIPDIGPDTTPDFAANPCKRGALEQVFSPNMVLCVDSLQLVDQCQASELCDDAAGWSLCTASQYQSAAGDKGASKEGWVAGCVRNDDTTLTAPKDTVCTCRRSLGPTAFDVAWGCNSAPAHRNVEQVHIGVIAFNECRRVGENDKSTEGMWKTLASFAKRSGAICCR